MKNKRVTSRSPQRNRGTGDRARIHDTYRQRFKFSEPTRCPECGAHYHKGHWTWLAKGDESGRYAPAEHVCPACQRIHDHYPAGEVRVTGQFLAAHREEIVGLARNIEQQEKHAHPLNRIMAITEEKDGLLITTTDVHLPHRIGHALRDAWEGRLSMHYDDDGYYVAVHWERDG